MTGHLVVISGLPGVGKASVAEIAAARTDSVHLSIDAVEEAMLACGLPRAPATRISSRIDFICLVVADSQEHERRLSGRDRGLVHVGEPTWTEVQRRRAGYAA